MRAYTQAGSPPGPAPVGAAGGHAGPTASSSQSAGPWAAGQRRCRSPVTPMETPRGVLDPGITRCAREVSLAEVTPPNGDCEQQ